MEDYYRVRFRKLVAPAGPRGDLNMPAPLRAVYGIVSIFAAIGWIAVVGRGTEQVSWFPILALSFPVWVALWLGFSEQQAWTRPLVVAALLAVALLLQLLESALYSLVVASLAIASAGYLYGSSAARQYYSACREAAFVRIGAADLREALFIPLYSAAFGAVLGAMLGYLLATQYIGYSSGLGANDVLSIVSAAALLAVLVGIVGRWLGEGVVSRLSRGP